MAGLERRGTQISLGGGGEGSGHCWSGGGRATDRAKGQQEVFAVEGEISRLETVRVHLRSYISIGMLVPKGLLFFVRGFACACRLTVVGAGSQLQSLPLRNALIYNDRSEVCAYRSPCFWACSRQLSR